VKLHLILRSILKVLFLFFLFCLEFSFGQKVNSSYNYKVIKASGDIIIDGKLNEDSWREADVADDFFMITPVDTGKAKQFSKVQITYDEKFIYIGVVFYNNAVKGDYNVESLKRDFSFGKNDNLLIAIDPFNNLTTGFTFGLNAYGAQWDGTMYDGASVDLNWDTKWYSEVSFDQDQWIGEMAIPFKSIRYPYGEKNWGINFSRLDLKASEKSSWAPVPRQFPSVSLAFTGSLEWDEPPPKQSKNVSIIPFFIASKDMDQSKIDIGGDVKYSLNSSLNLDVTINPDFSQTEVDQQVTNLDRFELFFPEKRQFFLENADLFSNFGYKEIRPFFSRRIGLDRPINYGFRLSGNINESWRIGLMDLQTPKNIEKGFNAQNFAVVSLQKKVFKRSNIGFLFVNRQTFNDQDKQNKKSSVFDRNFGVEYNYASSDNIWNGKILYLKSMTSEKDLNKADVFAAHLEYKSTKWKARFQQEVIGEDFETEVGYTPRKGFLKTTGVLGHLIYKDQTKGLLSHGPRIKKTIFLTPKYKKTDDISEIAYLFNFNNRSTIDFVYENKYILLTKPFDPTGVSSEYLEEGSEHNWNEFAVKYNSKPQNLFQYQLEVLYGGYYNNGKRLGIGSVLSYRFQPILGLSSILTYNRIKLNKPWGKTSFWLYGLKADLTLTNKLFFTNLFQYNEQLGLWNFNSRFQWRYKPASDIYLVFNSNEVEQPYYLKTWNLSLKINYWLNF